MKYSFKIEDDIYEESHSSFDASSYSNHMIIETIPDEFFSDKPIPLVYCLNVNNIQHINYINEHF